MKRTLIGFILGIIICLSGCTFTYSLSDDMVNYKSYILYPDNIYNSTTINPYSVNYTGWQPLAVQIHMNLTFASLNSTNWYNIDISLDGDGRARNWHSYAKSYLFTNKSVYCVDVALRGANGSIYIDLLHNYYENYPSDTFVHFTRLCHINFVFDGELTLIKDEI